MSLEWKGDAVKAKIRAAMISGVNTTLAAAVLHAKANHGPGARGMNRFESQTGALERSVRIVEQATRRGSSVRGTFGSIGTTYALRREFGFQGQDALGRSVNDRPTPFLIPAAQAEFPKLAQRIEAAI